jgi:DNA-binding XRE family transcriptional regulator
VNREAPKGTGGALRLDRSYNFVEKRPVLLDLRDLVEGSGSTYRQIAERSGVSKNTLVNWFNGKTTRPQAPTLNAVAGVFGKRLGLVNLEDE